MRWLYLLPTLAAAKTLTLEPFGGKAWKTKHGKQNGQALVSALENARPGDTILIPKGKSYYFVAQAVAEPGRDVTLQIEGNIILSDAIAEWPIDPATMDGKYFPMLKVINANGFKVRGHGVIDGQGHRWWWAFAVGLLPSIKRPLLFQFEDCNDLEISDVSLVDSPRFNIWITRSTKVRVNRVNIFADWRAQLATQDIVAEYKRGGDLPDPKWFMDYTNLTSHLLELPMFPFNTDGVDVSGKDIIVQDCVISNWDDVVCVKPSARQTPKVGFPPNDIPDWTWCTSEMLVKNLTGLYGGGASVGSVHPTNTFSCVNNVTFEDIELWAPLKGVYVKPDHGICTNDLTCACLIANVHYRNVQLHQGKKPVWWDAYEDEIRSRILFTKPPKDADVDPDFFTDLEFRYTARQEWALEVAVPPHVALTTEEKTFQHWGPVLQYWRQHRDDNGFTCRWWNYLCMIWPIWLGTQQQLEPDGSGSGIWPTTDPRAIVINISLVNVTATGGRWPEAAAAIRFNSTNPATGIHLEDLNIAADAFLRDQVWICDDDVSAFGDIQGSVVPDATNCLAPTPSLARLDDPVLLGGGATD